MQAYNRLYNTVFPFLCRVVILAGLVVMLAEPAMAFEYKDLPRLKLEAGMSESQFKAQTQVIRETPPGDKKLAFRIRLPKDWKKVEGDTGLGTGDLRLSSSLLSTVAHYRGPGSLEGRSFFKLRALKLGHMITARKWFMNFILGEGYSVGAIREFSPRRVAARYTVFRNNTSYTVLAVAAINGDQLAMAEYHVPTARMNDKLRDRQLLSMRSFALVNVIDAPIEPIETYNFVDIASIAYPESWLIQKPRMRNLSRMNIILYNTEQKEFKELGEINDLISGEKRKGRIRIKLIAREKTNSIKAQLQKIRARFHKSDLKVDQMVREVKDIDYDSDFDLARTQVYTISDEKGNYLDRQLWVAVMRSKNYYVFATLLTPNRDNQYYNWAVNSETFKFVLGRLNVR